uniref:Uncharacterized protein n=1 Tax=Trypanosoma congolense (strain IL3000) TaxID=1068625 RepID=G0UR32_TRYCI|nr:hypothetical protein, unlikely [Trypanosoma congolense IL3000]
MFQSGQKCKANLKWGSQTLTPAVRYNSSPCRFPFFFLHPKAALPVKRAVVRPLAMKPEQRKRSASTFSPRKEIKEKGRDPQLQPSCCLKGTAAWPTVENKEKKQLKNEFLQKSEKREEKKSVLCQQEAE